ncbi:tetratricopeptide repeat protein [Bacteroidota bacterium]
MSKLNGLILYLIIINVFLSSIYYAQNPLGWDRVNNLLFEKKYQKVIDILEERIEKDSTNNFLLYKLGIAYQGIYNFSKAADVLSKASRLNSNDINVLLALAANFKYLGNNHLAATIFKEIIEKDEDNIIALIELGKIQIILQNYEKAAKIFTELIKEDSTNSYFFKKLALCNYKLNKSANSIQFFKKAFTLNKYDSETLLQIAKLYYIMELYDSSYVYLKKGIELNPISFPLNRLGGDVLFKLKKYRAAAVQFEKLLFLGDSTAITLQKYGISNYFNSTSELDSIISVSLNIKAINSLVISFKKDSEDPLTPLYLGLCYKFVNNHETAVEYFNKTLELLYPDYLTDVYTYLGSSFQLNNQYNEAIRSYKKALELDSSKKILLYSLAVIYDRFYADRSVPLIYYEKFLREGKNIDQKIKEYAEFRVDDLIEENHFKSN